MTGRAKSLPPSMEPGVWLVELQPLCQEAEGGLGAETVTLYIQRACVYICI